MGSKFDNDTTQKTFSVKRNRTENIYQITLGNEKRKEQQIPFVTNGIETAVNLLKDTLNLPVSIRNSVQEINFRTFHSQPSDSLFTIMMHRSDNFFAEQTLLMASNEKLGFMSDAKMIDYVLTNDLERYSSKT